jgi:hypothetical protein
VRVAKTPTLVTAVSIYSFFVKNLDEGGAKAAYSLEFSNAARTAMIAVLWVVVFAVVWSIMVVDVLSSVVLM